MGSNAIRFAIAQFKDIYRFSLLERRRFALRLGHDAFTDGVLSDASIEGLVRAARVFRGRLDELGVGGYRAVATSAVRESRNCSALIDAVRAETAIELEPIGGDREARLVWLATRHRVALDDRSWLLADLGGGSLEVSIIDGVGIRWSATWPLGAVRLVEALGGSAADGTAVRELVDRRMTAVELPDQEEVAGLILVGGNAEVLADMLEAPTNARGVSSLSSADLRGAFDRLASLSFRQRMERFGLREDRADVIVPAALVFSRIAALAGTDRILVPRVGVKEGLLLEVAIARAGAAPGE